MVYWFNMKRIPNTHCRVCAKPIYRRPVHISTGEVYCSKTCTGIDKRKTKTCPICNALYVGYKKTCSRACANKSRAGISYTKEPRYDKAYRGRLLKEKVAGVRGGVCERCSEPNYAILQVHHKKERYRGGSDTLSNLELLCPNCHTTHHLGFSLFHKKE